jgi:hypothetical protein
MKIAKRIAVTLFVVLALSLAFLASYENGKAYEKNGKIACCWHMWVLRVDEPGKPADLRKLAAEFDKQIPLKTVGAARYHTPAYDYDLQ